MPSRYPLFDRSKITLLPLANRIHDLDISHILPLDKIENQFPEFEQVTDQLIKTRTQKASSILMLGAHVIRAGVQRYIIDLMQKGFITCIAVNGACAIHDFEFSLIGATTESVSRYIENGQFGLWKETGEINRIINKAAKEDVGFGEAIGAFIHKNALKHSDLSIFAEAYRLKIPITVHLGIGYDIIHEHPNCDGSAIGKTSYLDFLIFTQQLTNLSRGMIMNFGSAVMGPEVFLKALAMIRNVSQHKEIKTDNFTTLVCDLKKLPTEFQAEASKKDPLYYFRPWKTMLVRTQKNSGQSYYVQGDHRYTIPALWSAITNRG